MPKKPVDTVELRKQLDKVKAGQVRWFVFVKGSSASDAYLELAKTEGEVVRSGMKAKEGRTTVVLTGQVSLVDKVFQFTTTGKDASADKVMARQLREGLCKVKDLAAHKDRLKNASIDGESSDSSTEDVLEDEWVTRLSDAKAAFRDAKRRLGTSDPAVARLDRIRTDALKAKDRGDHDGALALLERLIEESGRAERTPDLDETLVGALDGMQDAIETVNNQLNQLATVIKKRGEPGLIAIADLGLSDMAGGGNLRQQLSARMLEIRSLQGARRTDSMKQALKLTASFRGRVANDERYAVCDDNPFGVSVTSTRTLTSALVRLERAIQANL